MRDELIRMAREAGFLGNGSPALDGFEEFLERFFNLAFAAGAAHEREACAKVCDEKFDEFCESKDDWFNGFSNGSYECAAAIRARGSDAG